MCPPRPAPRSRPAAALLRPGGAGASGLGWVTRGLPSRSPARPRWPPRRATVSQVPSQGAKASRWPAEGSPQPPAGQGQDPRAWAPAVIAAHGDLRGPGLASSSVAGRALGAAPLPSGAQQGLAPGLLVGGRVRGQLPSVVTP